MKVKKRLCSGLLLLLCVLLVACAAPLPEEPSAPEESGEVPLPEDPNAKAVRADLEELLAKEWSAGDDTLEWLPSDRAEAIRERVKKLKAPILTEADAMRIAEQAAAFCLAAWEAEQPVSLPACGVLAPIRRDPAVLTRYAEHAEVYNALLSYTLYLFSPPDYLFFSLDVWTEGWFASSASGADPASALCLPFAGEYTSRSEALTAIRESQSCIRLYPLTISDRERPLDFSYCAVPDLLRNKEYTALELGVMAEEGSAFRTLWATEGLEILLDRCVFSAHDIPMVWVYDNVYASVPSRVYVPFESEDAQRVRDMTELRSSPFLWEWDVLGILETFHEDAFGIWFVIDLPFLLPGVDGAENVQLSPEEMTMNQRSRRIIAYTVELFTPSAYRYTNLFDRPGTYYKLAGREVPPGTYYDPEESPPEEESFYVLVTEDYELYLADGEGNLRPLYLAEEETPA